MNEFGIEQNNPIYETIYQQVGFEVLTVVSMKMAVFWVIVPCSLVEVYQCFRGPCCLHYQSHLLNISTVYGVSTQIAAHNNPTPPHHIDNT
jgi:hypothetical protein